MAGESLPDGEEAPPPGVRAMGMVRWALVALMAAASLSAWIYFLDAGSSFARSADQYRCPMHPSVLRERPGSCSICGMDLALVAHGTPQAQESPVPGLVPVEIPAQRTQLMGVRTAKVVPQRLAAQLRTVGFVSANESSVATVATRFSGWVEELRVAQAGQHVQKGQVLATASGPELITAQQVFLAANRWAKKQAPAAQAAGIESDSNNALQRLGIARQDIQAVARRGQPLSAIPIRSPISGYVAKKSVSPGLYVQPGTELFRIADLSTVWVVADVYEQDAGRLQVGARAQLSLAAYPGETFIGKIEFIYPALDLETRTLQARMELANPGLKLRPGMYGEVIVDVPTSDALTVPNEAVIDTGELQYVFLARGKGRFEPRIVRLGASAGGRVQVLEGLAEADEVVTTANFLVDSESRLRSAVEAFGAPAGHDEDETTRKTARAAAGGHP